MYVEKPLRRKREYFDYIAEQQSSEPVYIESNNKKEILRYAIDETLKAAPGKRILDIGCGTGTVFPFISGYDIFAFDLSARMIDFARLKTTSAVQVIMQADAHRIPVRDKCLDGIICVEVYPHIIDKSVFLDECYRVLRKDGVLGIIHLTAAKEINNRHEETGGEVKDDILPEQDELIRLLEATGFTIEEAENNDFYFLLAQK